MGTPYQVGSNFERRLIKYLTGQGWFCLRSAGSHSYADVAAFRDGEVRFYQCQIDSYFTPIKKEQLISLAQENGFQAWLAWRDEKKKVVTKQIY